MCLLLCCVMDRITFKLYNNAVTKVSLPLFRAKEIEAWRGPKQGNRSTAKTPCLPAKP